MNVCHEKIWLKSGGFLVIQQTEAFVSIDVNSGKYTGKKKAEETYRKINSKPLLKLPVRFDFEISPGSFWLILSIWKIRIIRMNFFMFFRNISAKTRSNAKQLISRHFISLK